MEITIAEKLDWTHKNVSFTDIRKLNQLYLITIDDPNIKTPLKVADNIFRRRIEPFFLKKAEQISREEIMAIKWNMYITKGYFIKIDNNEIQENTNVDSENYYVSFLEIAGPLGTFESVIKK